MIISFHSFFLHFVYHIHCFLSKSVMQEEDGRQELVNVLYTPSFFLFFTIP